MNTLKWLLAGIGVGVIAVAFRDVARRAWLTPANTSRDGATDEEPFLGYDGMDQETLLDWIDHARIDDATAERIARYEEENRQRQPVLDALEELLG